MTDIVDTKTRSDIMRRIKGAETQPEKLVRKFLRSKGYAYYKNYKKIIGKPDIVLRRSNLKTIIDVRGCFWHMHKDCPYGDQFKVKKKDSDVPAKRRSAVKRDERNLREWKKLGWNVIIVWSDCELGFKSKDYDLREKTLKLILDTLIKIEDSSN